MNENPTCIFCQKEATEAAIPGPTQDAYRIECPCGTYDFSEAVEEDYKRMNNEDKQAVSGYIRDCNEKNEIPELHKLFGTNKLNWHIANYKKKRSG